jgi:hypothetical protein
MVLGIARWEHYRVADAGAGMQTIFGVSPVGQRSLHDRTR